MLKRGEKGIVILAGDARPIEIICHFPVLCEDKDIPYCFVPSQKVLFNIHLLQPGLEPWSQPILEELVPSSDIV